MHLIDRDNERVEIKATDSNDKLDEFINNLVVETAGNNKSQFFKERKTSVVIGSSINSIQGYFEQSDDKEERFQRYAKKIAEQLLHKESERQDEVEKSGIKIKKGSLLQAVVKDEEKGYYYYFISKVEHNSFFEDGQYDLLSGFSADKNRFLKSCLITFQENGNELEIASIKVYLDNKASYWYDCFLEIDKIRKDEQNTQLTFSSIESVLKKVVWKKSKRDYQEYRNNVLGHMKRNPRIHYDDMIKKVFEDVEPNFITEETKKDLLRRLYRLPEEKEFDREFNCDTKVLKAKRNSRSFSVIDGVKVVLDDYVPEESDKIVIEEDVFGNTFLKIKTTDEETLQSFSRKKSE